MDDAAVSPEGRPILRGVLLLALAALAALGLTPPTAHLGLRILPAVFAASVCVVALRYARAGLGFAFLIFGIAALMSVGVLWQLALPLAIMGSAVLSRHVPMSQGPSIEPGRVPIGLTLFAGLVTPGALVGWVHLFEPDISDLVGIIPQQPIYLLALGGAVFALANATFEEWVWRGIFQPTLRAEFGLRWAIVLQAVSFGLAHAHGFPRGVAGVVLAGSWAVLLGILRQVAGGLLAPVLAHVVADAAIASIVIWLARAAS